MAPLAGLNKRAGACLVNEVVVEQLYGWQCGAKRVATHGYPALVSLTGVYAKAKSAVIYAHQFVVGEESASYRVNDFLVADFQKRPLANLFD